jgi:hypothetical protein
MDIAAKPPYNWAVAATYHYKIYAASAGLDFETAEQHFYDQQLLPGPDGDSSWNAVLARLTRKVPAPAVWEDSPAFLASYYFPVASWNWIVTLRTISRLVANNLGERH